MRPLLLLLAACTVKPPIVGTLPDDTAGGDDHSGGESGDESGEESGDDSEEPPDEEVCDGVDNDGDGLVDEGVPSDGAGCQDPGAPERGDLVGEVTITLVTGTGSTNGSDDPVGVCLGADWCFGMDLVDWNDREPGYVDIHHVGGLAIPREELDRFRVYTTDGADQWVPVAFAASLDGQPTYCREVSLRVGSEGTEVSDWTDPDGLSLGCTAPTGHTLTHGPLTGAVGPDSAHIWYRTDATRRVLLRVAASADALATAAPVHFGYPSPDTDYTEEVEVVGLGPDADWWFDLEVDGERLGPWSLHTAPDVGVPGQTRIAVGSCTKLDEQEAFAAVLAYDPDLYFFIGDNHYGNTPDLGSLRQYYRWAHERTWRADLLHSTSVLSTWDDHDFVGNNTDGTATGKENALRAFDEYWANDGLGTSGTPGVFHEERWGDLAFFFIDDRYYRGLQDSITGDAQEAWLIDAVTGSDATFKLVMSGSQWTTQGTSDSWAEWPDAQDRVLDALSTVPGVVLLSGDVHRSEFRLLENAAGYPIPELTSSGMAYDPLSGCTSDSDVLDCYDDGLSFLTLDIDTTVADPLLRAVIRDVYGGEELVWEIRRSELD